MRETEGVIGGMVVIAAAMALLVSSVAIAPARAASRVVCLKNRTDRIAIVRYQNRWCRKYMSCTPWENAAISKAEKRRRHWRFKLPLKRNDYMFLEVRHRSFPGVYVVTKLEGEKQAEEKDPVCTPAATYYFCGRHRLRIVHTEAAAEHCE